MISARRGTKGSVGASIMMGDRGQREEAMSYSVQVPVSLPHAWNLTGLIASDKSASPRI